MSSGISDIVVHIYAHKTEVFEIKISILVLDMISRLFIPIGLTMSKIYHINERTLTAQTDHKVLKLNLPIYIPQLMYLLNSIKYLKSNKEASNGNEPVVT